MEHFDLNIDRELHLLQGDDEATSYTGQMSKSPGKGKDVKIKKSSDQKTGGKSAEKDSAKMDKSKLNKGGKTQPANNKAGGY